MIRQPLYFVREYYPRGKEAGTTSLLLSHYTQEDIDSVRAHRHYKLIRNDPYRFLYDSRDPEHKQRLEKAAEQPAGFRIYVNLVPKTWKPPDHLRKNIYAYMLRTHPEWKISGQLNVNLQDLFGKLYLIFSWRGNKVEVLLDEVEKFSPHVL